MPPISIEESTVDSIQAQLTSIGERTKSIETRVTNIETRVVSIEDMAVATKDETKRISILFNGDADLGVLGIRDRVKTNETLLDTIVEEREKNKWLIKGIAIGLGITSLGSIATVLKLFAGV